MKLHLPGAPVMRRRANALAAGWWCLWLGAVGALAAAGPARPAGSALLELDLEQLLEMRAGSVEGASRRVQPLAEAPSAVTIITAEDIQRHGYRSFTDVLNSVPGLHTSNDRDFWYLGARGFNRPGDYNTRYLLLIDGHRVNNNVYDSAPVGPEFPLDLDLIRQIEVIPGPGAAMYGNNAFFGVINVITKRGRELQGVEAAASVGSHGAGQGRFTYGQFFTNTGVEVLFSGTYLDNPGPRRLSFTDAGGNAWTARRHDGLQSTSLHGSLAWKELSLQAAFSRTPNGIPSGAYGSDIGDPRAEWEEQYGYVELKWDHAFAGEQRLQTRAFCNYYRYQGSFPYSGALQFDDATGLQYGLESQFNARLWERHQLTLGAEARYNARLDQIYEDESGVRYLDDRRRNGLAGVYAQMEWLLRRNLRFTTGARFDYHSWLGGEAHPRLGLIYQPWQRTTLKALYGTAFRAPNVFEMYYGADANYAINPDLRPETIRTYELVLEQQLHERARLRVSGYQYAIRDLVSMEQEAGTGLWQYQNLDRVRAVGLETALEYRLPYGARWRGSYALQRARSRGALLDNSPQHLVKNHLQVPLYRDRWWVGTELLYASDAKTGMAGMEANDYWLLNLTLWSRPLGRNLDFSASVYNVLGHKYAFPVGEEYWANSGPLMEFAGREFRLKLTFRF